MWSWSPRRTRGRLGASAPLVHGRDRLRRLYAVLRVLALADLALLQVAVEQLPEFVLSIETGGMMYAGTLAGLPPGFATSPVWAGFLPLSSAIGRRGRLGRQDPRVLPDRHRLPAGDDVLDALRRRVLTAQRDRLQALGLERRDNRRSRGRRWPRRRRRSCCCVLISICWKIVRAFWLSQPGTN